MSWQLVSGEAQHAEFPETFEIPSLTERQTLRPGQHVKLMFKFDVPTSPNVERMWVLVEEVLLGGYRGRLDNQPVNSGMLKLGAKIDFRPEHVINILESTH